MHQGRSTRRRSTVAALVAVAAVTCAPALVAAEPLDPSAIRSLRGDLVRPAFGLAVDSTARPFDVDRVSMVDESARLRRPIGRNGHFYRAELLPRLESRLGDMIPPEAAPILGDELQDNALYEDFADLARSQAERGTRNAVRDYLLETTSLSRVVEWARGHGRHDDATGEFEGGAGRPAERRRSDVDLRISGGMPKLRLSYRAGEGEVHVGFSLRGTADVSFAHPRLHHLRFGAGWNPGEERVDLGCRLGF